MFKIKHRAQTIIWGAQLLTENRKAEKARIETQRKNAEHAKKIAKSQAKIGPYVPVSYTQVWA